MVEYAQIMEWNRKHFELVLCNSSIVLIGNKDLAFRLLIVYDGSLCIYELQTEVYNFNDRTYVYGGTQISEFSGARVKLMIVGYEHKLML